MQQTKSIAAQQPVRALAQSQVPQPMPTKKKIFSDNNYVDVKVDTGISGSISYKGDIANLDNVMLSLPSSNNVDVKVGAGKNGLVTYKGDVANMGKAIAIAILGIISLLGTLAFLFVIVIRSKRKDTSCSSNSEKTPPILGSFPALTPLSMTMKEAGENVEFLFADIIRLGGIHMLFGPKGQGKSTLAMQIGLAIASGKEFQLFADQELVSHVPQRVLYLDFELAPEIIRQRMGDVDNISPHFFWQGKCISASHNECVEQVRKYLQDLPQNENVTVFIDNITKIGTQLTQPELATDFYRQMESLQREEEQKGRIITFILVGHTNKDAKDDAPISDNDLAGAGSLIVPADSVIAIGPTSLGRNLKHLKVLHNRHSAEPANVSILTLTSDSSLHFEYVRKMPEKEALKGNKNIVDCLFAKTPKETKEHKYETLTRTQVEEMTKMLGDTDPATGKTYTQKKVAQHFGIPDSYIKRYQNGEIMPKSDATE